MRLLLTWRWSPHRCPSCDGYSEIPFRDRLLFAGLPAGVSVIPAGWLLYSAHLHGVALYLSVACFATVMVLIIAFLLARFARFRPLPVPSHDTMA